MIGLYLLSTLSLSIGVCENQLANTNLDCLSDNNISFLIKSSLVTPPCAKGVIYNVPLDIPNNELLTGKMVRIFFFFRKVGGCYAALMRP